MGIFTWLKGNYSNRRVTLDTIWLTRQARLAGISAHVDEILKSPGAKKAVILVAHFPVRLSELESIANSGDSRNWTASVLASDLDRLDVAATLDETYVVEILVAERHPLRSRDDVIAEFARRLPCRSRVTFHLSLEDGLMKAFAGEWTATVLRKLGMKEGEAIESRMVVRRIQAAQKKIESRLGRELPASSAEEWIELNASLGL